MKIVYLITFLTISMIAFSSAFKMDLDISFLVNLFEDYLDETLKAKEAQNKLYYIPTKSKQLNPKKMLSQSTDAFAKLLRARVKALEELRKAVLKGYQEYSSTSIPCSEEEGKEHSYNFRTKVNFDRFCEIVSPYTSENAIHLTSAFTFAAARNLEIEPDSKWQYFASEKGVFNLYPSNHVSFFFDGRSRPWYVLAKNLIRKEFVFILDRSGSMNSVIDKVKLIEIAKEAIKVTISRLSSLDKFAVVIASNDYLTPGNFSHPNCFDNQLALATGKNFKIIGDFLNQVKAIGGSSYITALTNAFHFFEDIKSQADRRVILISDAEINESPEDIKDKFKFELNKVQNTVHLEFFGVGQADFSLFEDILLSISIESQQRNLVRLKSINDIYNQINFFFQKYENTSNTVSEPKWTLPYYDAFGLGATVTVSLPVYKGRDFLGVVAIDISVEEIFIDLNVVLLNPYNYFFIITSKGEIVYHPIFPISSKEGVFAKVTYFEHGNQFSEGIDKVLGGLNEFAVNATIGFHSVPLGGSEFHGSKLKKKAKMYYMKKVPDFPYIIIISIGNNVFYEFTIPHSKPGSILHHRFDLIPPSAVCNHRGEVASADFATLFLKPSAFKNPTKYVTTPLTAKIVQEIVDYLEGNPDNPQKVKETYRAEVAITGIFEQLWKIENDENANLREDTLLRFVALNSGVLRHYPGFQLPDNFDPHSRTWFRHISALPGLKFVLIAPYVDSTTNTPVLTLGRALYHNRMTIDPRNQVIGVVGMDLSLLTFNRHFLEIYSKCKFTIRYRCYLIDTAGYPLAISYFKKEDWFKTVNGQQRRWQSHITQLESEVSKVLISNKVMVKIRCIHLVKGDIGISYEFSLKDGEEFTGAVQTTFFNAFDFKVTKVADSNILVLIRTLPVVSCFPGTFKCQCRRDQCYSDEEDLSFCQCPCFKHDDEYRPCNNSYPTEKLNATPCVPYAPTLFYQPEDLADSASANFFDSQNLQPCYTISIENEEAVSDKSVQKILLMCYISLVVVVSLFVYLWNHSIKKAMSKTGTNAVYWSRSSDHVLRPDSYTSFEQTTRRQTFDDLFLSKQLNQDKLTLHYENATDASKRPDPASNPLHSDATAGLLHVIDVKASSREDARDERDQGFFERLKHSVLPSKSHARASRATMSNADSLSNTLYRSTVRSWSFLSDSNVHAKGFQKKDTSVNSDVSLFEEVVSEIKLPGKSESNLFEDANALAPGSTNDQESDEIYY